MTDDLIRIARRLYGMPSRDFVAARNDTSRSLQQAGDSALAGRVKSLRKPTAGADLVNRLARDADDLMARVRDVGLRLRAAQAGADAVELRALDQERRAVVTACVQAARSLAVRQGAAATEATLRDVEQSVWAALVDPTAAAALQAAVLVRPMSPSGFGAVDVSDASAVPVEPDLDAELPPPAPPTRGTPAPGPGTPPTIARQTARRTVAAAEQALRAAEREATEAARGIETVEQRLADLERERAALHDQLRAADQAVAAAKLDRADRLKARTSADRSRRAAEADVARAREQLEATP